MTNTVDASLSDTAAVDMSAPLDHVALDHVALDHVAVDDAVRDAIFADTVADQSIVDAPLLAPPRPLAPLSGARVTNGRPTLHWRLDADATGTWVEISRDRDGLLMVAQFAATGDSARPPVDAGALRPGVYFWRLRRVQNGASGTAVSATWQFIVPAGAASADTSWGAQPDLDGDRYADLLDVAENSAGTSLTVRFFRGPLTGRPSALGGAIEVPQGYAARVVGDVDGDGFVDLAIRSTCGDGGATDRVDIHRGGPRGPSFTPEYSIRWSGYTCVRPRHFVGAGDVNGDGYGDLVVDSPVTGGFFQQCEVYHGGPRGPSTAPDAVLTGGTEYTGFGRPVALGDVNGDGFADVAFTDSAGFVRGDPSALIPPHVRVYLGSARGLTAAPPVVLSSPLARDPGFGRVVAGPLDVDGDGLSDVVVDAAAWSDPSDPTTRRVYVFRGSVDFAARAPTWTHEPRAGDARFSGQSFAGGGDVDGDGFDDLVLALDIPTGVLVQVARGGAMGIAAAPSQWFVREGASVDASNASAWGDITGDGLADIVLPVSLPGGGVPATGRAVDAFWGRALPLDERPGSLL